MSMGSAPSQLDITQTTDKIGRLIRDLDTECDEILHKNMRPEEVALLIMLHRKHSDRITFNASHVKWSWRKGSLTSEYDERIRKLRDEGKITTNRSPDSETYINKVKKELIEVDSDIFPNDNNEVENSSSDEESEEKLKKYFSEQNIKLTSLNRARIQEIIDEAEHEHSSDAVDDMNIRDNLLKKLDELNNDYKKDMLGYLKNQSDRMTELLNKYHEDQLEMVKKMDEERLKENEKRTCPSSFELLDKLKSDNDPELDFDSRRLIDDMTNNIMKKTTKPEELRKLFTDHCGRERQLRVSLELPHREEVQNEEEAQRFKYVVARHLRDHPVNSPNSIIVGGNKVQEIFDTLMEGAQTRR